MIDIKKSSTPSFTKEIKEEIVSNQYTQERIRTILSGFIKVNSTYQIKDKIKYLVMETMNAKVAKFLYQNIIDIFHFNPKLSYLKSSRLSKKTIYRIIIENHVDEFLLDLDISFFEGKIGKTLTYNDDVIGGYIAGAFLAGGSCVSPLSSNYHLEIALDFENHAKWLMKLINNKTSSGFNAKLTTRRGKSVVYIKRSDQIADFLILIGASNSCLRFENIRLDRDFKNVNNRLENCDSANLAKAISASEEQIKIIDKIYEIYGGFDDFNNPKLALLAFLRKKYSDATMLELAQMMSDELKCEISKSNVNHLFRKMNEIVKGK